MHLIISTPLPNVDFLTLGPKVEVMHLRLADILPQGIPLVFSERSTGSSTAYAEGTVLIGIPQYCITMGAPASLTSCENFGRFRVGRPGISYNRLILESLSEFGGEKPTHFRDQNYES